MRNNTFVQNYITKLIVCQGKEFGNKTTNTINREIKESVVNLDEINIIKTLFINFFSIVFNRNLLNFTGIYSI